MDRLVLLLFLSSLYAMSITWGIGRRLDEYAVTRPIIVAAGVSIVVLVHTWGEWQAFNKLFLAFGVAAIPQIVRVGVLFALEQERTAIAEHDIENDRA